MKDEKEDSGITGTGYLHPGRLSVTLETAAVFSDNFILAWADG